MPARSTRLNGDRASGKTIALNWRFTDTNETLAATLDHAALTYVPGKTAAGADASVVTTRAVFNAVVLRQRTFDDARTKNELTVTGNAARLNELMSYLDDFDPSFTIVEPRRAR